MRTALALLLVACGSGDPEPGTTTGDTSTTPGTPDGCVLTGVAPEVITVNTRDGVALEADRYAGNAGAPGFVLLHMIPPSNTRADWPRSFIDRLTCHGWSVVALDRRGAGGSDGTSVDSYEGPAGVWDVEAAVGALTDVGADGIALIGASNGTTSALDYTVAAAADPALPDAVAIGFMTGGAYTENQNPMSAMPGIPAVFTYSTAERAWSVDQQPLDPGGWSFLEYDDGDHGTRMFDAHPKVKGDLEDFFVATLTP